VEVEPCDEAGSEQCKHDQRGDKRPDMDLYRNPFVGPSCHYEEWKTDALERSSDAVNERPTGMRCKKDAEKLE
jgi:hypothetical protein